MKMNSKLKVPSILEKFLISNCISEPGTFGIPFFPDERNWNLNYYGR